ncbi:MAG: phosphopentomutase [Thermoleophilia bacterium]|nr:phosphopentomutase [Thermoleophilia bacterium]
MRPTLEHAQKPGDRAMARFVFLMLDGVGVGALPDADEYGDAGSDTLGNLSRVVPLHLPTFQRLGLGNIVPIRGVPPVPQPDAVVGRLAPRSAGKDTTVGHWEHMGLVTPRPFPTYPQGFPPEVMRSFEEAIGRPALGNKPASGTAIITELGEEHVATGNPIVYTSADSVFQIAAHVDVVPLAELYHWCEVARGILQGPHAVARVIARPFAGSPGAFYRTKDRRDFSLAPPASTYLDLLEEAGVPVFALGKIGEIFCGRGITAVRKVADNTENLRVVCDLLEGSDTSWEFTHGMLFTNLVDFDMVWGHRNDVDGFACGLTQVDEFLPRILSALAPDDRLIVTADHGVDPTTPSTDHSREYVPVLLYPRGKTRFRDAVYEGEFADTGATVYAYLTGHDPGSTRRQPGLAGRQPPLAGRSILSGDPSRGWRPYTFARARTSRALTASGAVTDGGQDVAEADVFLPLRLGPWAVEEAAQDLEARFGPAPQAAVILGSGLSAACPSLDQPVNAGEIRHWPVGSIAGHPHMLGLVDWGEERVLAILGRPHAYEGFDLSELQLPVKAVAAWGVKRLVITNACGGLDPALCPGDVVVVEKVLDFIHASELEDAPAPGFPTVLAATPRDVTAAAKGRLGQGVDRLFARVATTYAAVPGPQYETPAEVEVLRALGADVVGMSTAAEVRAVYEEGLRLAVLSLVTNAAAEGGLEPHVQVVQTAADQAAILRRAVGAVLRLLQEL